MDTFVKLKNGNIILLTKKTNDRDVVGHGINVNSPYLKQVNFPLSRITLEWKANYEEIGKLLKKTYVGGKCSSHDASISKSRWEKIFYALAEIRKAIAT